MNAKLLPLKGKYYGTEIEITDDRGTAHIITLWDNGSYVPSERELDGISEDDWRANVVQYVDPDYGEIRAQDVVEVCDSHFESKETYELALSIMSAINGEKHERS